jgi:hypothetical protein
MEIEGNEQLSAFFLGVRRFLRDIVCGTTAGIIGISVGYPLDTVRVTLQTTNTFNSSLDCIRYIVRKVGFFGLYRGILSPISGYMFSTAVSFSTFGFAYRQLKERSTDPSAQEFKLSVIAGSVAGATFSLISNPVDRVKIIMQYQASSNDLVKHKNTFSCAQHILKTQGLRSLYYGYPSNVMKEFTGSGAWFGIYHGLKKVLGRTSSTTLL